MKIVSAVQRNRWYAPSIEIDFPEETYQEILNVPEISTENLWSAVGGFVGIFLGYSLMQMPELVFTAFQRFKMSAINNVL